MRTYERIIQTSVKLFNEDSERNVTTNHIAAALEISPGNLYYHFRNKEEIVFQAFLEFEKLIHQRLSQPLQQPAQFSDLVSYLEAAFSAMWRYRFLFVDLAGLLGRNPPLQKRYQEFASTELVGLLNQLFTEFRRAGLIITPAEDINTLGVTTWLVIQCWFGFKQVSAPTARLTELSAREGMMQVLALMKPHIAPACQNEYNALIERINNEPKPRRGRKPKAETKHEEDPVPAAA
jgi:AcrR family transcriptional regulator